MAYQQIPLDPVDDQEVEVVVEVGGENIPLCLRIRWNEVGGFFSMGVSNDYGRVLLNGLPLVTGLTPAENLLSAYQHLNIGEAILLPATEAALQTLPDVQSLGRDYLLLWGDDL